jgi:hypothetical protein
MIIYNPFNTEMLKERMAEAERILDEIPAKTVFITGSFLFKESYKDIDVFVVTRSHKEIKSKNKKVKITKIPFNNLHSLFYHSISKSCISKDMLPTKKLRVTVADYWGIVNEAIPMIFNEKKDFRKDIRYLVLYTEYLLNGTILDSHGLTKRVDEFKDYGSVLAYAKKNIPAAITKHLCNNYIKRFFYTQSGFYKDTLGYESHKYLYDISHTIIKEASINGRSV